MKKRLMIAVALFLTLALAFGVAYGVMASSTDGEVGISLTIVGTSPPPTTPPPTGELGFRVDPAILALGEVQQGTQKVYFVTLTRLGGSTPITVYVNEPTISWGSVHTDSQSYQLTTTKNVVVYISINPNANPGTYNTSLLFHR